MSLIKLLAVAGVIIISSLVALNFHMTSLLNAKTSEEAGNLSAMYQTITNFYSRGNTQGLDSATAIKAGFVPKGMQIENDIIKSVFNSQVIIKGITSKEDKRAFSIEYTHVPAAACSAIVRSQTEIGWDKVHIKRYENITASSATVSKIFRSIGGVGAERGEEALTDNEIVSICKAGSDDLVSIVFEKNAAQ